MTRYSRRIERVSIVQPSPQLSSSHFHEHQPSTAVTTTKIKSVCLNLKYTSHFQQEIADSMRQWNAENQFPVALANNALVYLRSIFLSLLNDYRELTNTPRRRKLRPITPVLTITLRSEPRCPSYQNDTVNDITTVPT